MCIYVWSVVLREDSRVRIEWDVFMYIYLRRLDSRCIH